VDWLSFTFAALREPRSEPLGKTIRRQAKAGFHLAVSDGEGVVKFGGIGEVAHAELVEPFERTETALAANQDMYFEFLSIHREQEYHSGDSRQEKVRLASKNNRDAESTFADG
jgi:hypothetical protein